MPTPSDVVSYLASIKNAKITRVIPCYVTIGRQTYPAARYMETMMTPTNSPAWARGEREYTQEVVYCVGSLPSAKLRGNVAFILSQHADWGIEETREWYVASYYGDVKAGKQETKAPNEFHPFGNSFMLAPWSVPDGGAIDHYARVPYRRVAVTIGA